MVKSLCKGGIFQAREGLRGVDRVRNHMRMKDGSELEGHTGRGEIKRRRSEQAGV